MKNPLEKVTAPKLQHNIKVEKTRFRAKKGKDIVDGLTKIMPSNRFVDMLNATFYALMAQLELASNSEYIFYSIKYAILQS